MWCIATSLIFYKKVAIQICLKYFAVSFLIATFAVAN